MISSFSPKVYELGELAGIVSALRAEGKRIVHAHGVFDLLHPGHIRHLAEAKSFGDVLVVTITEDRFVNKGPHRPAFGETLRAESLAALGAVDYVAINRTPTAVEAIAAIRPDVYAKGPDYARVEDDVTAGILAEDAAVRAHGGTLRITEDITFSSSALINEFFPAHAPAVQAYLRDFRSRHSARDVVAYLDRLQDLRVLVVGEAILDEYIYCDQMGKSAKDPVLAMRYAKSEISAGGALAIANHLAGFCRWVDLITYLGTSDVRESFVRENLKPGVRPTFIYKTDAPTIVKRRYVESTLRSKLLEVYFFNDEPLIAADEERLRAVLAEHLGEVDAVVCADYGHGLLSQASRALICESAKFLAVNTQINAANIRYHAISSYPRADYVCINEAELRLDARSRDGAVDAIVDELATRLACKRFLVTQGSEGVRYADDGAVFRSPSFTLNVVDRIGAGDAVLALTSCCVASGVPAEVVAFVANVVGAQAVQVMGNRSSVERAATLKFIEALLK